MFSSLLGLSAAAHAADLPSARRPMSHAPAEPVVAPKPAAAPGWYAHLDHALATLPPPPAGVTDLRFSEIYRSPVGPGGLELTDKVRSLHGKRVRMLGYMVKQANPSPWKILLSPVPRITREREYSHADDLPPNVVHVFLPRDAYPIRPHTPGLLRLPGRLGVGTGAAPDARVSLLRLHLDPAGSGAGTTATPARPSAAATADK
jgi:hypothetical protein